MLRANQNRGDTVGALALHSAVHPLGGVAQHPAVEAACPQRLVGDTFGKLGHTVFPVPLGQVFKVQGERMVGGHVLRLDVAFHVPVPALDAFTDGTKGDAVQRADVHGRID